MIRLLQDIESEFLRNAAEVRRLARDERAAEIWESAAARVAATGGFWANQPLSIDAAVTESGYSKSQLRRHIREGVIPNSGTRVRPAIQRAHLPRKPGYGVDRKRNAASSSQAQAVRAAPKKGS